MTNDTLTEAGINSISSISFDEGHIGGEWSKLKVEAFKALAREGLAARERKAMTHSQAGAAQPRHSIARVLNRILVPLGLVAVNDPIIEWRGVERGWVPIDKGWHFRVRRVPGRWWRKP